MLAVAGAAIVVLAGLAAVSLIGGGHPARARAAGTAGTPAPLATYSPGADPYPSDHPAAGPVPPPVSQALTLGRPGAAVTIVEFGDYQCTSCGAFARDTEPALIRRYVDAGVVRLVWRDFPWVDGQSVDAAVAARAAGMQGRFWAFHDYLFAHQLSDEHSGLVTGGYLRSVARRLGLNMAAFDRDVAGPALAAAVRADGRFGQQLGVPGTPAFLINGQQFFGAQPLAAFEAAIANARGGQ
jgi:protein-disulfide isomerase